MNARAHFFCPATQSVSVQLPSPSQALREPNGLLAVGGTLNAETLLSAYRQGIFPWYSQGQPILWWSPDPRAIIWPDKFHVARSLRRTLRRRPWRVTVDCAFGRVIAACAAPRRTETGSWLTPAMIAAYTELHRLNFAHSVECWVGDELAGGLYGVAVGDIFCGESMFSQVTDGSKVALYALCQRLVKWGYRVLDCQIENPHLRSLGAESVSRHLFCEWLDATDNDAAISAEAWQPVPQGAVPT